MTFDDLTRVEPDGSPAHHRGSGGLYTLADWTVYHDGNDSDRQATLFGQFGIGDQRVNRFAYYTGGGLTFSGFIPARKDDEFGVAVAAAHNGTPFIQAQQAQGMPNRRSEITVELMYLAQFGAHLAVQPDLQFVFNPTQTQGSKMQSLLSFGLKLRCDAYDFLVGQSFWVTRITW